MKTPADDILLLLKTRGPARTQNVADALKVSRQAARVHLEKLEAQGLVAAADERDGVGRPRQAWSLTPAGHGRFPDTHAQMTVELIEAVREEFGVTGLERLVARREAATTHAYRQALARDAGLEARLERLAELRRTEGYMAEWRPEPDGGYLLIENHCPICAAAQACQGFCRSELALCEMLLAPARVERVEHLLAGARRCAYRVTRA
jgi:predicted ArsR family transcriptional regulator